MLKRNFILFLLLCSYTIVLGHSIIPHHHHDSESELIAHHNGNHHHDDAEEGFADLNHLFSHFVHSADGFTSTHIDNTNNTISKQHILILSILPSNFSFVNFTIQPVRNKSSLKYLISAHSLSCGLRAPPVYIA